MGFLDKAKAAAESAAEKAKDVAEQATSKAKEGVDEVQTKRALGHAYEKLGHTAYELAKSGEISHPKLTETVEEINGLEAHLAEADKPAAEAAATNGAPAAAPAADAPHPDAAGESPPPVASEPGAPPEPAGQAP